MRSGSRFRASAATLGTAVLSACATMSTSPFRAPGSADSATVSADGTLRIIQVDEVKAPWSFSRQLATGTGFDPQLVVSTGHHKLLVVYKISGSELKTTVDVDVQDGYSYLVKGFTQGYRTKVWVEPHPVQRTDS
jgi:hypothetical protein